MVPYILVLLLVRLDLVGLVDLDVGVVGEEVVEEVVEVVGVEVVRKEVEVARRG